MAHWTDQYERYPYPLAPGPLDKSSTEELVIRIIEPGMSPLRLAVAKRLIQHDRTANNIDDASRDEISRIVEQIAREGVAGMADPRALDVALDAIFCAMPQPPARKETSPEMASLASRILGAGYVARADEIRSLAASVLSQDQTPGQG